MTALDISKAWPGTRTWANGERCNECCNGDRCDDPTHYDRTNKLHGCPYCLNTGYALWTEAGRKAYNAARGITQEPAP